MATATERRVWISLILSYVLDWIIIALIAVAGALFTLTTPNHHPFSPTDPSIAYPFVVNEKVSTSTLVLVALVAPGIITALVCLVFAPGRLASREMPTSLIWRRKLWEWNTAWMGLGLALAAAFMITDGMKNLFGKPRPDLLARCNPDMANLQKYVVGGFGTATSGGLLVSWQICRQTNLSILNDGFASFPSGHSSFSWAGLTYLSLFLCSKFAIAIPYLLPGAYVSSMPRPTAGDRLSDSPLDHSKSSLQSTPPVPLSKIMRSQAAAPPTYLLVIAFIPIGAAIYISSTRWSDFFHHGFDIIFGSLMGFLLAWGSFRWYHAPIRRGAGWAWGPRSSEKAWGIGMGVQGYASESEWKRGDEDLENGVRRTDGQIGADSVEV
ncbi:hypothetical protein MMC17_005736 [Xylographa soralifera]|nr:hypothetical protein [Xylographa soralifera]